MHSARGQGTVEYVGVLLLVAVLIGAIAGGFGVPRMSAGIASSITHALLGAIGLRAPDRRVADGRPSADERAAFARATDPALGPDERPSLRDVRLALVARHGAAHGQAVYRELVLDDLRLTVPGLGGPTLFATASPGVVPPRVVGNLLPIDARVSLTRPPAGDPGEIETPIGEPSAHVVTVSEADRAFDRALHPGVSYPSIALDVFTAIPAVGNVTRLAVTAARLSRGASRIANAVSLAQDAETLLAPSAESSPPGSREGDEIVSWTAIRRPTDGGDARRFARTAVVRDGLVIREGIARAEGA
jgi:hypothetical protein